MDFDPIDLSDSIGAADAMDTQSLEAAADGSASHPSQQQRSSSDAAQAEVHDDAFSSAAALAPLALRLRVPPVDPLTPDSLPSLHLLPCRVAHTGPANVPNYFRPTKAVAGKAVLTYGVDGAELKAATTELYDARFRGRQMTGSILRLPEKAKGFVFQEDHTQSIDIDGAASSADAAPQSAAWKVASTFDSFLLWQPDLEQFERGHLKEVVNDWTLIAHAIHDPVA